MWWMVGFIGFPYTFEPPEQCFRVHSSQKYTCIHTYTYVWYDKLDIFRILWKIQMVYSNVDSIALEALTSWQPFGRQAPFCTELDPSDSEGHISSKHICMNVCMYAFSYRSIRHYTPLFGICILTYPYRRGTELSTWSCLFRHEIIPMLPKLRNFGNHFLRGNICLWHF